MTWGFYKMLTMSGVVRVCACISLHLTTLASPTAEDENEQEEQQQKSAATAENHKEPGVRQAADDLRRFWRSLCEYERNKKGWSTRRSESATMT